MDGEAAEQLLLYYYAQNGGVDTGSMTLPDFASFVKNEVAANEEYASLLDGHALSQIQSLSTFTDARAMTARYGPRKIASLLGMDGETVQAVGSPITTPSRTATTRVP